MGCAVVNTALNLLDARARELGFAKSLLRDFIAALDAPEDVRDNFIRYAKAHAERELSEGGRLAA
jgi:transcription initiation factor TFIIIB Brf1 subunit/transcription initiation factor TFIIB